MNWSSAFQGGLGEMFKPRGQENQKFGGMFTPEHNTQDNVGPMPEQSSYEFTPGNFAENRLNDTKTSKVYQFLKGFLV